MTCLEEVLLSQKVCRTLRKDASDAIWMHSLKFCHWSEKIPAARVLATLCDEVVAAAIDAEAVAETVEVLLFGELLGAPLLDECVPRV